MANTDPRKLINKECQDNCSFSCDGESLLISLFDGHGVEGTAVSRFCIETTARIYSQKTYKTNPGAFTESLAQQLDTELKGPGNRINASCSGTTAVFILLYGGTLYWGSVGDSRAVMGQTVPGGPNKRTSSLRIDPGRATHIARQRMAKNNIRMFETALTEDQKPEDPAETQRIMAAGGRIQRMVNEQGNPVGPYKIWRQTENTPGFNFSRSIGDTIGDELGVIATPISKAYKIDPKSASFIIVASDGIWDVMENIEAVNFVEKYRNDWVKNVPQFDKNSRIGVQNSCIAQLLCEEARVRWLSVVEAEDIIIDDISCVIVELQHNYANYGPNGLPLGRQQMNAQQNTGLPNPGMQQPNIGQRPPAGPGAPTMQRYNTQPPQPLNLQQGPQGSFPLQGTPQSQGSFPQQGTPQFSNAPQVQRQFTMQNPPGHQPQYQPMGPSGAAPSQQSSEYYQIVEPHMQQALGSTLPPASQLSAARQQYQNLPPPNYPQQGAQNFQQSGQYQEQWQTHPPSQNVNTDPHSQWPDQPPNY